ncbi:glycosyltransferase [Microbacterium sp. F2]|uniref:glycosyltransferase n=1 Tax=Microbacterium sp. F2 TaxID=3422228 RepID=UPI003FD67494
MTEDNRLGSESPVRSAQLPPAIITHDWIERYGGAEKVLDSISRVLPSAPIYTLWSQASDRYPRDRVVESVIAGSPLRGHKAQALPLMPTVWSRMKVDPRFADPHFVLSSTHLFAHHGFASSLPHVPRLAYVHTPARYLWNPELDPRGSGLPAKLVGMPFRQVDRKRAQGIAALAANSKYVSERIRRSWGRESEVIFPPVDTDGVRAALRNPLNFEEEEVRRRLPPNFILGASRFVRYKALDEVIRFGKAVKLPVVLAGDGPDLERLETYAADQGVTMTHVRHPSDRLLYELYRSAEAYVFPAIEDFGIMPVEAMAAGARVVVADSGGAAESVVHEVSGIHTSVFSGSDAVDALARVSRIRTENAVSRADTFSTTRFEAEVTDWILRTVH